MPRDGLISGMRDCAKALAAKRNYTIGEAKSIVTDVIDIIIDEIDRTGGVQFVNKLTIKKKYKHERQGINPSTQEPITITERNTLKLTVGKGLMKRLNPMYDVPISPRPSPKVKLYPRRKRKPIYLAKRPVVYGDEPSGQITLYNDKARKRG